MQEDLKCADARHLIHLAVGDDLLEVEEQQLAGHLPSCSLCRTYHSEMVSASHVLEQVRDDVPDTVQQSVWPELSKRLKKRVATSVQVTEGRRFNVAVATLCACSIVLAFVTAVQNLPSSEDPGYASMPMNAATNVAFQGDLKSSSANSTPQLDPSRLIPFQQPNGDVVLIDPVTSQTYIQASRPVRRTDGAYRF